MTVTQKLMKPGSWDLTLVDHTPKHIRTALVEKGYIVITPAWLDVRGVSDASILSLARYSGVVQEVTPFSLAGDGLASLIGDGDGVGPVIGLVTEGSATLSTWVTSLLAAVTSTNGITAGTITNTGTTLTHSMYLVTLRAALNYVCAAVGAEWRINPNGTLDAAVPGTLFASYTTPSTIVVRKGGGRDYNVTGLTVDLLSEKTNAREWTSSVLLAAEGEGAALLQDFANIGSNPYVGFSGAALDMTRMVDSPSTEDANTTAIAQAALNLYSTARREISLSTDTYDIGRFVKPGDTIWVHDPDRGLVDTANQVMYRGAALTPKQLRVFGYSWPVQRGMGVYYRTGAGVYTDLTPYVEWEEGATNYEVGAPDLPIEPDIIIPTSMTGPKTNHAIHERRSRNRQRVGARLRRSSGTQSINSGAVTVVTTPTEDEDPLSMFDQGIVAFVAPWAGVWSFTGTVVMESVIANRFFLEANVVSTLTGQTQAVRNSCAGEDTGSVHVTCYLTTSDNIQLRVFHTHGSARNVTAAWIDVEQVA